MFNPKLSSQKACWSYVSISTLIALAQVVISGFSQTTLAQIIPDETLGSESSVVTPDNINNLESDRISGGAVRGSSLFHSFQEFNIDEGRGAYFENPAAIQNIFSRVTGNNPSNLLGTLGVLGNANLFFMNPNGIIFGRNASLDIRGSFLATTADSILFPDGNKFSALNPEAPPLLTVNVQPTIGLQFEGREGIITNQGILAVDEGQNLALVGGNLTIDGGGLIAPGGRVDLGGLSEAGTIGFSSDGSLSFPDGVARADVLFTNGAFVDVLAGGEGAISIHAKNLELSEASNLSAGIAPNLGSPEAQSGDITLDATEAIDINRGSQILNQINPNATGISGNINIKAGSFSLSDEGSSIDSSSIGQGNAGNIVIDVAGDVNISGTNPLNTSNFTLTDGILANNEGQGNGGNVSIFADGTISLVGGLIFSVVFNEEVGNGGEIDLIANGDITLSSGATILSAGIVGGDITLQSEGNISVTSSSDSNSLIASSSNFGLAEPIELQLGGDINITAASLEIVNQGAATVAGISNFSSGVNIEPGDINIKVEDTVTINGSGSVIGSSPLQNGRNGDINLETGSLVIQNGGLLSSNTILEEANRGEKGGDINITADFLSIIDGGLINTSASGVDVDPGNINIKVSNTTTLEGFRLEGDRDNLPLLSSIGSTLGENTTGRSGDISLETGSLTLKNGASIGSINNAQGDGGDIRIQAEEKIRLEGGANLGNFEGSIGGIPISGNFSSTSLSSQAVSLGDGGNIEIVADSLEIVDGAQIASNVFGQGNAGNIDINVRGDISLAGTSPIIANDVSINIGSGISSLAGTKNLASLGVATGNSGTINITANSISLDDRSVVSTGTFGQGDSGNIFIQVEDSVSLSNRSFIGSTVLPGGSGRSGNIDIQTAALNLIDGSAIFARLEETALGLPSVTGAGGDITIKATDSVNISGFSSNLTTVFNPFNPLETSGGGFGSSGLYVDAGAGTTGNPGTITVETGALRLAEGGVIQASTANESNAREITINAKTLEAINGGQILAVTENSGNGGNINLNIADSITITGSDPTFAQRIAQRPDNVANQGAESAILALTTAESTGNGGNIIIDPATMTISNGAEIAVDSEGKGRGGNIILQAGILTLDDGKITAETASNRGGNITLTLSERLNLRNKSKITATAGTNQGTGDGGNITLDSPFIISSLYEDNDITANASFGNGGRVEITSQGIFGIEFRNQETALSDITASSEFGQQGEVNIDTEAVDPTRGLNNLPQQATETEVAQTCQANNSQTTLEFFDIGRGGLPPTPEDLLNSEVIIAEWMPLNLETTLELPTKSIPEAINKVTLFRGCLRSLIYYTNAGLNSLPPYNPPKLGGMGNLQFISPQSWGAGGKNLEIERRKRTLADVLLIVCPVGNSKYSNSI